MDQEEYEHNLSIDGLTMDMVARLDLGESRRDRRDQHAERKWARICEDFEAAGGVKERPIPAATAHRCADTICSICLVAN